MAVTKYLMVAVSTISVLPGALPAAVPVPLHEGHIEGRQCTGCPQPGPNMYCPETTGDPKGELISGPAWTTGAVVTGGGTVGTQQSYAVGSSWGISGSLGMAFEKLFEFAVGLEASVSVSYENGAASETSYPCPEGGKFSCSLNVVHGYRVVRGVANLIPQGGSCPVGAIYEGCEWEATMPAKNQLGVPEFRTTICTCANLEDADNPLAPAERCVGECVGPPPAKGRRGMVVKSGGPLSI